MRYRRLGTIVVGSGILTSLLITAVVFLLTGFLRPEGIDARDTIAWNRDSKGVIDGHEAFSLRGTSTHCWLLVHSFAATPDELRVLATRIHSDLGDTVVVPRLYGHATVPSDLQRFTMDAWYTQVRVEYQTLAHTCAEVSVVGSSIGGALALRLAEDNELHAVYAVNPYLYHTPRKWYYPSTPEWAMELFEPLLHYVRRHTTAQIADPIGRAAHVAYYHLPVQPMKASRVFFETTEARLHEISEPLLVLHAHNDPVSDFRTAETAYAAASSPRKLLLPFHRSEHILLRDYEREEVVRAIISFATSTRVSPLNEVL